MKSRFTSMLCAALSAILLLSLPLVAHALTVTNIHSFGTGSPNGAGPWAGLVQTSDGNFYGTTQFGGTHSAGVVFRISPSGTYTTLYSFADSPDGSQPFAGLVQGSDSNFYGTTYAGGSNINDGTVFRISPSGSYTNLHRFAFGANDGLTPRAALVQGSDGNFYGTAETGGASGAGVVFRISPSGSYTNLYSFGSDPSDGIHPIAGLVLGSDGNFYGTANNGGTNGFGTVFRINPSGGYTNLHRFAGGAAYGNNEGQHPLGALVPGPDGNFYGTTTGGGGNIPGNGTVFRISLSGSYATVYSFTNSPPDGSQPEAGLVLGSDGNFYGTTVAGGTNTCGCGTVFRISPSGQYTHLYSFVGGNAGQPQAVLVQGSDGNFYGTTYGASGGGTVFKLVASLASPANQVNGVSVAGTNVVITVSSVAGETYQLQYTTDLTSGNWSNVPGVSVTNSIGGTLTVTNFGGAVSPGRYYRWTITP